MRGGVLCVEAVDVGQICKAEVVAFVGEGKLMDGGVGVAETIAEVEAGGMAAFAETEESFEGGSLMFDSEVEDLGIDGMEKVIQRDPRVNSSSGEDQACLNEDWRSYGYKGCTVHQDLQFVELGLVIERANDCGSIKKHQ